MIIHVLDKSLLIKFLYIFESVTFKMTHFAFVNKGQNQYDYPRNLTLIDKCKMCHFECNGLNFQFKNYR